MIKGMIFDHDGVIAHTTELHYKAFREVFLEKNINLTRQEYSLYNGRTAFDTITGVLEKNKILADSDKIDELMDKKDKIYLNIADKNIQLVKGIKNFLHGLRRKKIKIGLASSSRSKNIKFSLEKFEMKKYFDVILTGSDILKGKPDPELFLKAAEKLHLTPKECLVFEDAAHGIEAAKKAGMRCIALLTTAKKEELSKADLIIKDFKKIKIDHILNL